ncbi:MAG: homoserine kinase [Gammaproteobacteria bacterium]
MESVTAFAPASVGNVGVGFDLLGHALEGVGDTVTLRRRDQAGVRVSAISGRVTALPVDPERNTAARPVLRMIESLGLDGGVDLELVKGIPLGSGMGGSAASAVASVVAADALWRLELPAERLLMFALEGERVTSGAAHPDNAAPSLLGGLVLTEPGDPPRCTRLPAPPGLVCVLCHPERDVRTEDARRVLSPTVSLEAFVRQSGWLAGFVAGCFRGDTGQVVRCLRDEVIGPQRAGLVPALEAALDAAREAGAEAAALSGSGPSVFAWTEARHAAGVAEALGEAFAGEGLASEHWVSAINAPGARVLAEG